MTNATIITTIRNRNAIFADSLQNWLQFDIPIIVVDWRDDGCERAYDVVKNHLGRIRLFETKYEYIFHKELALNLALSQVETANFLMLDVDYILKSDFFEKNILHENEFITGHGEHGQGSLSGFIYCKKQYADAIGGYNENLPYWGFADTDFFYRLKMFGFTYKIAVGVHHKPHSESLTFANQFKWGNNQKVNTDPLKFATWSANKAIAEQIGWTADIPHVQWQLDEITPSVYLAVRKF